MNLNKKLIQSGAIVALTGVMTITSLLPGSMVSGASNKYSSEAPESDSDMASKEKLELDYVASAELAEEETVEVEEAAPVEEVAVPEEAPVEEAPVAEPSPWDDKVMPKVEEYLTIRTEPSTDAGAAGKLYKGASADVVERLEGWTKISSGSVEGYVSNDYIVFGAEAEAMANEQGTVYATSNTEGLRVRAEASADENVRVVNALSAGKKLEVDTTVEAPEGWVAVKTGGTTAYVSAEFVTVELELGKAISIAEEQAAIAKAKQEKEAAAAKSQNNTSQKEAVSASTDDLTLLAALIEAEAGGECYEGQVAVGAVVMNRLRAGYAGSISGVIYARGQFTPAGSGKLAKIIARGPKGSCISAAQEALNGVDNVGGRRNFHAGRGAGLVIGNQTFY